MVVCGSGVIYVMESLATYEQRFFITSRCLVLHVTPLEMRMTIMIESSETAFELTS